MSVQGHYRRHLAGIYSWMKGDFATVVNEQRSLLASLGVSHVAHGRAIDLGAGPGYQSAALKDLGYEVQAVDTSEDLLAELKASP